MRFIRDLIGKNRQEQAIQSVDNIDPLEKSYRETIGSITNDDQPPSVVTSNMSDKSDSAPAQTGQPAAPAVNIWDLDHVDGAGALPETAPALPTPAAASSVAARSPARARRTKTRLLGFEKSNGDVVDLFNDAPQVAMAQRVRFPVGWIVVAEGPGRGESFALLAGMSQIGRGEDQAVQLDFGDNTISRNNHAAIVYDPESTTFLLGHGGKANIVRLNDKPVISNETLQNGDIIRIGETKLRFIALCDQSFNWADAGTEGDEDVAIA